MRKERLRYELDPATEYIRKYEVDIIMETKLRVK
jgi:hypothetical protein